jgi:4-alpha-glucanotransferase
MAVLQFAFDGDESSEFLPHNFTPDLAAYTGTHDNDTVRGWWFNDSSTLDRETRGRARRYATEYLGISDQRADDIHWTFNRALLASVARIAVLPAQDVIGLDSSGRMNTPGTVGPPNWCWRMDGGAWNGSAIERLKHLTHIYGRAGYRKTGSHPNV